MLSDKFEGYDLSEFDEIDNEVTVVLILVLMEYALWPPVKSTK